MIVTDKKCRILDGSSMSKHSKWAKIKRAKGVADVARGKVFTKLGRLIAIAARTGGADPEQNFTLRLAVEKARAANMPKDTIDRAIARAAGEDGGIRMEEVTYEAFGSGGAAILIEVTTDNRNRTLPELRMILTHHGGRIADQNSVVWMFVRQGAIMSERAITDEDELALIDAGASDIERSAEGTVITTPVDAFPRVKHAAEARSLPIADAGLEWAPKDIIPIDAATHEKLDMLVTALDEHDDVQRVVTNAGENA